MKAIHTTQAPAAIGPYSQAIEVNGFVFASGQIPIDPTTGEFVEGGIQEQTRQALTNASNILKQAGTDLNHVVKTTSLSQPEITPKEFLFIFLTSLNQTLIYFQVFSCHFLCRILFRYALCQRFSSK